MRDEPGRAGRLRRGAIGFDRPVLPAGNPGLEERETGEAGQGSPQKAAPIGAFGRPPQTSAANVTAVTPSRLNIMVRLRCLTSPMRYQALR